MRTKGVLLLGLIVCWTAVCNGEDGFLYDYGIGDVSSKELAEDYLFRADATVPCTKESECSDRQKCLGEDDAKTCQCADGLGGENCNKEEWCEDPGKFKDCKGDNGKCEYSKEKRSVVCTCGKGKKLHPDENICKGKSEC
ncbi:hypothetical protein AVEN_137874-1 [Araneus ventricosus]|uniref:EGF-like domain-containing protein n=1 Tax=Araneus ventricosus TaxID=182803 RepID=A0A4Y2NYL6_ARAVE|nr:hypothetical protein AVEN_137874-1 [Araneus ventricosus]